MIVIISLSAIIKSQEEHQTTFWEENENERNDESNDERNDDPCDAVCSE